MAGIVDGLIAENNQYQKRIVEVLERLEKAGSLEQWMDNAVVVSLSIPEWNALDLCESSQTYAEMKRNIAGRIGEYFLQIEQAMGKIKALSKILPGMYEGYLPYKKDVLSPRIVQFMRDYEEDHKEKERKKRG